MSDVIVDIGDGPGGVSLRLRDMGDGTVARVVVAAVSAVGAAGDKLAALGDDRTVLRLRDMGDGSIAQVFFGRQNG